MMAKGESMRFGRETQVPVVGMLLALTLAIALSGCNNRGANDGTGRDRTKPSPEKQQAIKAWTDKNGVAVLAQADHLKAIYAKAKAQPSPVAAATVDAPDLLFHPAPYTAQKVPNANAEILDLEELAQHQEESGEALSSLVDSYFIHQPAFLARNGDFPPTYPKHPEDKDDSREVKDSFALLDPHTQKLLSLKYVVLLRQTEFKPATVKGKMFMSGTYLADALVYRIGDEALVGTLRVEVKNSPKVMATTGIYGNDGKALRDDIERGVWPTTAVAVLKATMK